MNATYCSISIEILGIEIKKALQYIPHGFVDSCVLLISQYVGHTYILDMYVEHNPMNLLQDILKFIKKGYPCRLKSFYWDDDEMQDGYQLILNNGLWKYNSHIFHHHGGIKLLAANEQEGHVLLHCIRALLYDYNMLDFWYYLANEPVRAYNIPELIKLIAVHEKDRSPLFNDEIERCKYYYYNMIPESFDENVRGNVWDIGRIMYFFEHPCLGYALQFREESLNYMINN